MREEYLRKKLAYELALKLELALGKIGKEVLILTHTNADLDAAGAAVGISRILSTYGVKSYIVYPEGPSKPVKQLLSLLGISYELPEPRQSIHSIIIVDTANPVQLGEYARYLEEDLFTILIDHHKEGNLKDKVSLSLVESRAGSTSEIISVISDILSIPLDKPSATLLHAGIISDTRRIRNPGIFTFWALEYLSYYNIEYDIFQDTSGEIQELSERVALLKAASRINYNRICQDILIAITHIGSYESSVARKLVDLGADIAIVAKDTREGVRVSIRVSRHAIDNGLTADKIALYIAEKYGGEGGGHEAAAMATMKTMKYTAEMIAQDMSKRIPGKLARICVKMRKLKNDR